MCAQRRGMPQLLCLAIGAAALSHATGHAEEKAGAGIVNRRVLSGHESSVVSVAISPQNRWIATAERNGPILVWELQSGKLLQRIDEFSKLIGPELRFDNVGDRFVAFVARYLVEFEHEAGENRGFISKGRPPHSPVRYWECKSVAFARDGALRAYGLSRYGKYTVHDGDYPAEPPPTLVVGTRDRNRQVDQRILAITDSNDINTMVFADKDRTLAVAGTRQSNPRSGFVALLDVNGQKVELRADPVYVDEPVSCLAASPDGALLILGLAPEARPRERPRNNVIVLGADGSKKIELVGCGGAVSAVATSRDSKRLFVAGEEKDIHVFSSGDWKEVAKLEGHSGKVKTMSLSNDGKWLAAGGSDGHVILWQIEK